MAGSLLITTAAIGCTGRPATAADFRPSVAVPLAPQPATANDNLQTFAQFRVRVTPPAGWRRQTTSADERHEHITWTSANDDTAFGVIFFRLPWPVGHELAFRFGFLAEMRRQEKEVEVLEKHWDPQIEGLRFNVNSPNYNVQAKFLVRGLRGFAAYTGTRRRQPVNEFDLELARRCREAVEFAGEIESKTSEPRMNADERR